MSEMIIPSPAQFRMARAAINWTVRELGTALDVSGNAISRYERGDESVMSLKTLCKAQEFFYKYKVYFGPKDGICIGDDVFSQYRWYSSAYYNLLKIHGIQPSSIDIINAANGDSV